MTLLLIVQMSLRSLMRHKVRTALAMLGIMIGIASVIAMVAIGQGASQMIEDQVGSMGSNMVIIFPAEAASGGVSQGAGSAPTLTPEDAAAVGSELPSVKAVSPVVHCGGQVVYGDRNWKPNIRGEGEAYLEVKAWSVVEGDYFSERDVSAADKVCVVGLTVVENLFEGESSVGRIVRIQNMPFRVVGVLGRKGTSARGEDQDDVIILPWTTVRRVLQGASVRSIDTLLASAQTPAGVEPMTREITALLRQRHHLEEGTENDFRIRPLTEMFETATETSRLMTVLLAVIASISLVVGGIGIMNIMLIAVVERTREIGLRMAVGARGKDILLQFLIEAVLLSGTAGVLGVGLGGASAGLISRTLQWPTWVSPQSVGISVAFACGVGILFGLYPALRASKLDPIEALRYE